MRVSVEEALARGWVSKKDLAQASPSGVSSASSQLPKAPRGPSTKRGGKSAAQRAMEADAPAPRLWAAVSHIPGAHREFPNAVPGRRFKLDVAFPEKKLCIEIDGWEWHGKHKGDFQRDRERQNLLTVHGWRILRFTASDVRQNMDRCLALVNTALEAES